MNAVLGQINKCNGFWFGLSYEDWEKKYKVKTIKNLFLVWEHLLNVFCLNAAL